MKRTTFPIIKPLIRKQAKNKLMKQFTSFILLLTGIPLSAQFTVKDVKTYTQSLKTYTLVDAKAEISELPKIREMIIQQQKNLEQFQQKKIVILTNMVHYIQKMYVQDTILEWFIKQDNYVEYYPCYLSPYSEYCRKNKITGYCYQSFKTLYNLFNQLKIGNYNLKKEPDVIPFKPENIKALSILEYQYDYDIKKSFYQKKPSGRCISDKHSCLIVDVLKNYSETSMMIILTFNFPGKYYSLCLYDYANDVAVFDIQLLFKIDLEKLYTHSGKTYFVYWANHLLNYTNTYGIINNIKIYDLFELYEKMKIKDIYHISTNTKKSK